jgi:hypothetical protein
MICSRILIVHGGRLILQDRVENLEKSGRSFTIRVKGGRRQVKKILSAVPGVREVTPADDPAGESEGYCRFLVIGEAGEPCARHLPPTGAENLPIVELHTMGNSRRYIPGGHRLQVACIWSARENMPLFKKEVSQSPFDPFWGYSCFSRDHVHHLQPVGGGGDLNGMLVCFQTSS